jgi:hypothetical protein
VQNGTNIRIYEDSVINIDAWFIDRLLNTVSKRITFSSQIKIDAVRDIETGINIVSRTSISSGCSRCKDNFSIYHFRDPLCQGCFVERFDTVVKKSVADYYRGLKAYIGGGAFTRSQVGTIHLTQKYIIFSKMAKDPSNRWEITIPLYSVDTGTWRIEEESRRKQVALAGSSIDNLGFGGGIIHETGRAHHIIIPHIDEYSIPQEPRFGISSFGGRGIREWAKEIYDRIIEAKRGNEPSIDTTDFSQNRTNFQNKATSSKSVIMPRSGSPLTFGRKPEQSSNSGGMDELKDLGANLNAFKT